jgi:choline dehydrogenase
MPVLNRRPADGPLASHPTGFPCRLCAGGGRHHERQNGLHPAGLGVTPPNNLDGVGVSTATAHLNPVRHHLNLTVRGGVFVRKIVIEDGKAVGEEAESGGKVFHVEADRVVLSTSAIRSPHLLMLSGIGAEDHLQQFGTPVIRHLPGVGQNLMNHLSAQTTFKVKDGVSLAGHHRDAIHFSLHYTAAGSSAVNDIVLKTARSSTHGRSASPVYGPSILAVTFLLSRWHGSRAR